MKYTSKYIEEILTSPSAKRGLNYITPIYQEAYNALWIMQAMGLQTDIIIKWIEEYIQQILPQTTTWLLPYFEEEYGIPVNTALSIEERRKNLLIAIRIRAPMNPTKFAFVLSSLTGIEDIHIKENVSKNAFYTETTIALNKEQVKKVHNIVNKYKPAHLIYWINIFTKVIFENYNFLKFHQLIISAFIKNNFLLKPYNLIITTGMKNYFLYPVLFNNKGSFDGLFNFNQTDRFFPLNLIIGLFIKNNFKFSSSSVFKYNWIINNIYNQELEVLFNGFIDYKEILNTSLTLNLSIRNKQSFNIVSIPSFSYKVKNTMSQTLNLVSSNSIKEKESLKATLTIDTMFHFDGDVEHDNTRRFNAAVLKLNI